MNRSSRARKAVRTLLCLFVLGNLFSAVSLNAAEEPRPAQPTPSASPYGTCSHLAGGEEHLAMPANLIQMRKAGIDWARADFSWSGIERPQGTWNFSHLEKLMDYAEEHGMHILPILDYDVPWATPAYEHPEAWLEYVRRTVTHFKDRIRYWEVWNEQNHWKFWRGTPDPAAYAELLKKTYQTIKAIDPELQVVYGGLAGVPAEYYEKTLQAGAGEFFDIANIHPYRAGLVNAQTIEKFLKDIETFRKLTVQYCGREKPLWITEMGWATPPTLIHNLTAMLSGFLQKLYPDGVPGKIAVISDPNYPPSVGLDGKVWRSILPQGANFTEISMDSAANLNPKEFPVLIFPPGEDFPVSIQEELENYVKEGGSLILTGGLPFYYRMVREENGEWSRPKTNFHAGPLAHEFRVHWIAWWTKEGTPETSEAKVVPEAEEAFKAYPIDKKKAGRYLTGEMLKEGDRMEPIFIADEAQWTKGPRKGEVFDVPCACVYRFGSDWKGCIAVSTFMGDLVMNTNRCVPENQGIYLTQSMLLALTFGVDRYFCYEFTAPERDLEDPESHFGITHSDLSPKTGFIAYQNLVKARPAGSVSTTKDWKIDQGKICRISWKRPDGQTGYAIWAPSAPIQKNVQISGTVSEAFTAYGKKVTPAESMTFVPEIVYLVGKDLEVEIE